MAIAVGASVWLLQCAVGSSGCRGDLGDLTLTPRCVECAKWRWHPEPEIAGEAEMRSAMANSGGELDNW